MTIKLNSVPVAAALATLATAGVTGEGRRHQCGRPAQRVRGPMPGEENSADRGGSPRARSLGGAFASASVPKHTSRRRAATRSRTELGTQH
jgi:hypothetical protein